MTKNNLTTMKKIFALLMLLCITLGANAQLLWKVSGNGLDKPSYLFGTHHVAPLSMKDSIAGMAEALKETSQVYGELVMEDMMKPEMLMKMQQAMMLPGDTTLRSLFTPTEYDSIASVVKENIGMEIAMFDKLKPAALNAQLAVVLSVKAVKGYNPQEQLDTWFQTQAKQAGKKVGGLESVESQINVLYNSQSLKRQAQQLYCSATHINYGIDMTRRLAEAYLGQDLDKLLEITEETVVLWKENVETMKALKEGASVNEAAVVQSEANYYAVVASVSSLKDQIRQTENALSLLLRQAPQQIERGTLDEQHLPDEIKAGVPIQLLANRPDVKVAEMTLASMYYNTNSARAAFYPSITISGSAGWTNSAGSMIVNPGKVLLSALGSLTQPIFNRGANIARLKIAKAQQEEAMLAFEQAILNAGAEVSNALSQYETATQTLEQRILQINSLEKSVEYTQDLLSFGTSTYLEVLTAQQSLLSAQLSGVSDQFSQMQALVTLYQALGGGVK